jgi:phosphoribosyl 1,2-cyclic phosphodiesterase
VLRFRSLASGSSGNATLIEAGDGPRFTRMLVDCGLGQRQLDVRLAQCGLRADLLDGIFITHEHGDHVGSALAVAARHGVPLWMSAGTRQALGAAALAGLTVHLAADSQTLAIGDLRLRPFTVPHDTLEPLQLRCDDGDRVLGILTDLGHVTPHVLASLAGCHALMLESNHDPDLLGQSRYPPFLQRRIAGPHGHLSNRQAQDALRLLCHAQLSTVVGAHLSERNNHPPLVQAGFAEVLGCAPPEVLLANRHGLDWLRV